MQQRSYYIRKNYTFYTVINRSLKYNNYESKLYVWGIPKEGFIRGLIEKQMCGKYVLTDNAELILKAVRVN